MCPSDLSVFTHTCTICCSLSSLQINKQLHNERALRLQDLHKNAGMANAKKKSELGESEVGVGW